MRAMTNAAPDLEPDVMPSDVRAAVEALHATPGHAVLAVTGAGSLALAWLLGVGGASRTVLEATVPYAASAFAAYAGTTPAEFASEEAARALATAALERAESLGGEVPLVGLGCAATIATDRAKRGEHRAHVVTARRSSGSPDGVAWAGLGLVLEKGTRERAAEEALVSRLVLLALAEAYGLERHTLALGLRAGEALERTGDAR
jgi:hypothetical protein